MTGTEETIYELKNYFVETPLFGMMTEDEKKCIINSDKDVIFVNIETGFELDIDLKEKIGWILNIISDDKYFYVLANKRHNIIGYYLFMVPYDDPTAEYVYLMNWTNKVVIHHVEMKFIPREFSQ